MLAVRTETIKERKGFDSKGIRGRTGCEKSQFLVS